MLGIDSRLKITGVERLHGQAYALRNGKSAQEADKRAHECWCDPADGRSGGGQCESQSSNRKDKGEDTTPDEVR